MSTIYLLRHGEIAASNPRRFIGQLDLPLTRTGRQQMSLLADSLVDSSIDRLVCSPLTRCRQSAAILADRLKISSETISELAEISLGSWEGLTVSEVQQRYPGQYEARGKNLVTFRPKNGESFQDLLGRTFPVFERICTSSNEKIVVVAHAGVNRVLLCRLLGIPLANLFLLGQDFGCINIINRESQGFRVDSINCLPGKKP